MDENDATAIDRQDDAGGASGVGAQRRNGRVAQHRQAAERLELFRRGIDDGQTVAAEPEPAEAVAGKASDAASVDDDGAGVSFVLAGRVDPQAAVGGDEQVSLVPGDGVQHLQVMGFFLQPLCFRARKDRMVHGAGSAGVRGVPICLGAL